MIPLEIALDATQAQIKFALLAGRFDDYSPVLRGAVYSLILATLREHFQNEGKAATPPWAPLKHRTVLEKKRLGFGDKGILRRTDRLYRAATRRGRSADQRVTVTPRSLKFAILVAYAKYHQLGYPPGNLPVRQVIPDPMPDGFRPSLRSIIRNWLVLGQAG